MIDYKIEESLPDGTPIRFLIKEEHGRLSRATRVAGGTWDWKYKVVEVNADGKEIAEIGEVVVVSPTSVIDRKTRRGNILREVGDFVAEHESSEIQAMAA